MSIKRSHSNWTTTEIAILKEIWESGRPMRTMMDRLPRHTKAAAIVKGHALGLRPRTEVIRVESPNRTAMREAIKSGAYHAKSLAEKVGVSRRTTECYLRELHGYKIIHICGWRKSERNGPPYPIFAWGKYDDEPKPAPANFRDRFRRRNPNKPAVDPFKQLIDYAANREAA
ncbi:MAG: hypothetical protein PW999_09880 [Paraburkholderia tropica]|nr:hypothetical protein [Paraburkholderia tropica]